MIGNVAEWTLDHYEEKYFTTVADGATDPSLWWKIFILKRCVAVGTWISQKPCAAPVAVNRTPPGINVILRYQKANGGLLMVWR